MAEVWRGEMVTEGGAGRPVALKFILPHLASDEALLGMFQAEASLSMRLSHGNVVQVFDFGQLEGRWFIAMEWVDGASLFKVLKKAKALGVGAVHPVMAAQLLVAVLDGLHHAHTRVEADGKPLQLVHRDVSPDNVLVSWDGQVKVADFGIARAAMAGRTETQPGVFKGKLAYGSPEQARAEAVDARADVYAAGVMLWELVTGENPAAANALQIAAGRARVPPFPPQRIDATFAALVDRAVAAEPEGRFPSAKAFGAALTDWLATQPATRAGPAELMAWLFPESVASPELKAAGAGTGQWLMAWKGSSPLATAPLPSATPAPPHTTQLKVEPAMRGPLRPVLGLSVGVAVATLGLVAFWPRGAPTAAPPLRPAARAPPVAAAPAQPAPPLEAEIAAALRVDSVSGAPALLRLDASKHSFNVLTELGTAHYENKHDVAQRIDLREAGAGVFGAFADSGRLVAVRALRGTVEVLPHQSVHVFAFPFTSRLGGEGHNFVSWARRSVAVGGETFQLPSRTPISEEHRFAVTDIGPGQWLLSVNAVGNVAAPLGVMAVTELGMFRVNARPVGEAVFVQTNTVVEFEGRRLWLSLPVSGETEQGFLEVRLERAEVPGAEAVKPPLPKRFRR
jgi:hypothetical protein